MDLHISQLVIKEKVQVIVIFLVPCTFNLVTAFSIQKKSHPEAHLTSPAPR